MNDNMETPWPIGPNVERVRAQSIMVVRGSIPREVRRELSAGVKAGVLGHLRKDGLKPEIYFHPDHQSGALERQKRDAARAIQCVAAACVFP